MFAVFNRAISRRSSCTLWRNSSMMMATVQFYTRGVRAVHKTERLSAVFGSITPVTPTRVEALPCPNRARGFREITDLSSICAEYRKYRACTKVASEPLNRRQPRFSGISLAREDDHE